MLHILYQIVVKSGLSCVLTIFVLLRLGTNGLCCFFPNLQRKGEEMPMGRNFSRHKDAQLEPKQATIKQAGSPPGVLQEIAIKCRNKVVFKILVYRYQAAN